LVAICTFGLFSWIAGLRESKIQNLRFKVAFIIVLSTLSITLIKYKSRTAKWYDPYRQNVFSPKHYKRNFDVRELYNALELIPKNEEIKVSAHFSFVPHIAFRKTLYEFPIVEDADYIAVLLGEGTYPLRTEEAFLDSVKLYKNSPKWQTVYDENSTVILRRK